MNLREGTRRLALLLGAVGAVLGGFASFLELQSTLDQRTRHKQFEQLANSDVVKQERKCRSLGYASGCSQVPPPPPGYTLDKPKYTIENSDGTPLASEVNRKGIRTIHWAKDYSVESIETEPDLYLYPEPAPGAWESLLIVLFPILGFFIPWGAVRAIGWVLAGFVQGSR